MAVLQVVPIGKGCYKMAMPLHYRKQIGRDLRSGMMRYPESVRSTNSKFSSFGVLTVDIVAKFLH
jgi:hypothetical protein